jgi:hypothetical protein
LKTPISLTAHTNPQRDQRTVELKNAYDLGVAASYRAA